MSQKNKNLYKLLSNTYMYSFFQRIMSGTSFRSKIINLTYSKNLNWSNYFKLKRIRHIYFSFIFFAFSSTSSIEPTYENEFSGNSSHFPHKIASKPYTVSSRETYLPFTPVNCSATKNG